MSTYRAPTVRFSGYKIINIYNEEYTPTVKGLPLYDVTIDLTDLEKWKITIGDNVSSNTFVVDTTDDSISNDFRSYNYTNWSHNYPIISYSYDEPSILSFTYAQSNIKDTYQIEIKFLSEKDPFLANLFIIRNVGTGLGGSLNGNSELLDKIINNFIEIPAIDILGQTLIDLSDVGNITFTIKDEFTYYKENPLIHKCIKPKMIDQNQLKLTIFESRCPLMVTVLKGKGATLFEKFSTIYSEEDFYDVYFNIILYGMLKYILGRILYGKFNIKYLLNKYYDRLITDLKSSRFCSFVELFTSPQSKFFGYNNFFR